MKDRIVLLPNGQRLPLAPAAPLQLPMLVGGLLVHVQLVRVNEDGSPYIPNAYDESDALPAFYRPETDDDCP